MVTPFTLRNDFVSWGRVVRQPQCVAHPQFANELSDLLRARPRATVLGVGRRRSYGDSVLNSDGCLIATDGLDRYIALDLSRGVVRADAGLTLDALLARIVPQGWFLPTTPGTRFVTLGGAVANDVHGKNHHRAGTFGCHVRALSLLRSDGSRHVLTSEDDTGLFAATIGGLGLTGLIEWVDLQLQRIGSSDLDVEVTPFEHVDDFWDLAQRAEATYEHTVAWIDCTAREGQLGRGIFSAANWRRSGQLQPLADRQRLAVPMDAPGMLLNSITVGLFNKLYYRMQARKTGASQQHYAGFFYPLDSIAGWNRLYGKAGFWQYQCVLPRETMRDGTAKLLREIADSGFGSFLAVLKTFGDKPSPGLLSFPRPGATLALDFANRGAVTHQLLSRLDGIVRDGGGRLYAAKDGRIPKAMWREGYPSLDAFARHVDPGFSSDFWRRVAA